MSTCKLCCCIRNLIFKHTSSVYYVMLRRLSNFAQFGQISSEESLVDSFQSRKATQLIGFFEILQKTLCEVHGVFTFRICRKTVQKIQFAEQYEKEKYRKLLQFGQRLWSSQCSKSKMHLWLLILRTFMLDFDSAVLNCTCTLFCSAKVWINFRRVT